MGAKAEVRRALYEFVLRHVTEQWASYEQMRTAITQHRQPHIYVNLRWIATVAKNHVTHPHATPPYLSEPARIYFLTLRLPNQQRMVQAALNSLVRAGKLMPYKARISRLNSAGNNQRIVETCYRPCGLLEALAHASQ